MIAPGSIVLDAERLMAFGLVECLEILHKILDVVLQGGRIVG